MDSLKHQGQGDLAQVQLGMPWNEWYNDNSLLEVNNTTHKNGISHCLKTLVVVNFLTKVSLDGTVMRLVTVNHHCQDLFLDLKSHLGWSFCRLSSLFPEFYSSTFNFPPYLIVNAKDSNVTLETMEESLHKGALAEEHFHCKTLT